MQTTKTKFFKTKSLFLTIFLCLTFVAAQAQTVRYVIQDGAGAGDGSSWTNASGDLQAMINASAAGDEIWVAAGTYYPQYPSDGSSTNNRDKTFTIVKDVKIYGGFTATETSLAQRNLAGNKSILSGDIDNDGVLNAGNALHVVTVPSNIGDALLDGFTITEGYGGSGAGIINDGAMKFSNLIIRNNIGYYGGGINMGGPGSTFTNVVIADNTAEKDAGGVNANTGTHYFTNVTIANNQCGSQGGGIFVGGGTVNLRNSIIWGNTRSGSPNQIYNAGGTVNHFNNLLGGSSISGTSVVAILDPQFTDAASGDYSLKPESPAIDMGDKTRYDSGQTPDISGIATDLVGSPRIQGGYIDLGAYESPVAFAPTAEGIVYVKEGATGKGTSWDDAYPNLAYPLRLATIYDIKAIYVAEGTYYPMFPSTTVVDRDKTFLMVAGVKIYGGFSATLTGTTDVPPFFGSINRNGISILSGDIDNDGVLNAGNAYNVVTISGNMGDALLDGFTITEGYGGSGAGIIDDGAMKFSNLIIRNNRGYYGGGINMGGTGSTFTNIVIADNSSERDAGGINTAGGPHYFTNVTIANNQCGSQGGAIYVGNGTVNLRNSIIWGNTKGGSPNQIYISGGGTVNHSNTLVQGAGIGNGVVAILDPQFTDAASGDYSLKPESPAIDMGDKTRYDSGQTPDISGITTDLAGSSRIQGGYIDLGAYEMPVFFAPTADGIVYVKEGATGKGTSWDDAYPNLAYPLRLATIYDIKAIYVAEGTYYPMFPTTTVVDRDKTFFIVVGVKIYGGFSATLTGTTDVPPFFGSINRNGISILSGDIDNDGVLNTGNALHVVTVPSNIGDALLDGFTITEGYGGSGAGIINDGAMKFSNLIIRNNIGYYGGGINMGGPGSTFTNVVIADNTAERDAGGVNANTGTHYFTNVTIANNQCGSQGGGIFVGGGTVNLRNSIIWGNTRGGSPNQIYNAGGAVNHSNTLVQGAGIGNGVVAILDPQFTDAASGDYSLKPESPAIDMGDDVLYNAGLMPDISDITTDLVGSPRIQGEHIDLGPYETTALKPSAEGMVYVIEGGRGVADGSSWDDAYPNLAYPLRMAKICGVKAIFVAEGTYYPMFPPATTAERDKTFLMVEDVKVYGGFNGTLTGAPTTPQIFGFVGRKGESILSGDIDNDGVLNIGNAYNVVKISGNMGDALLDGFTITEGYGGSGAGIIDDGAMKFSNLIIRNNRGYYGGGINMGGSGSTFTNIVIADNSSERDAGGINTAGGPHYFTNVTIANNQCGYQGGAIYVGNGTINLRNSIIWGNTRSGSPNQIYNSGGTVNHSYNLVQDGTISGTDIVANADPLFTGDYRLQSNSPAIDIGDKAFYTAGLTPDISAITADIAGNPRISGFEIDLGPYEFTIPITAINDTAMTKASTLVTIDVLANDDLGECNAATLDRLEIVVGNEPLYGVADIAADRKLTYTPNSGHRGIDSLKYEIECEGNVTNAWVYILTVNPLSKEYRACPGASVEIGFEAKTDIHYDWYEADGNIMPTTPPANTITVTKDASGVTQTYLARPFWKNMAFPFDTVKVHPALDTKPEVADIRVTLCPSPARAIYLTGYLDSLPYHSAVKWSTTGFPAVTDVATGALNTGAFPPSGVFTYIYTRYSECNTSWTKGKAYVHIPQGKIPRRHDTIVICRDQAAAINVSSIFGFELGGELKYNIHDPASAISDNVTSTPLGALFFDGAKAYDAAKTNPAYDVTYHGAVETGFIFEYDYSASNCIVGKKRIVIVIEN